MWQLTQAALAVLTAQRPAARPATIAWLSAVGKTRTALAGKSLRSTRHGAAVNRQVFGARGRRLLKEPG